MDTDAEPSDRAIRDAVDDEVFVALRDRTRRIVLYVLQSNPSVGVDELADVVTGWSSAGESGMATREDRDRTLAALEGRHLPVLQDAGLVEYDPVERTVSLGELPEPARSVLRYTVGTESG